MKKHKSTPAKSNLVTIKLTADEHSILDAALLLRVRFLTERFKSSGRFLDCGDERERAFRARKHNELAARIEAARAVAKRIASKLI